MASLRTPEGSQKYREAIIAGNFEQGCPLCNGVGIKTFTYWKVMKNAFPYDRIAKTHDMLVPLRHVTEAELTIEESKELFDIKHSYINDTYEYFLEATNKTKSIPEHFHIHLMAIKD